VEQRILQHAAGDHADTDIHAVPVPDTSSRPAVPKYRSTVRFEWDHGYYSPQHRHNVGRLSLVSKEEGLGWVGWSATCGGNQASDPNSTRTVHRPAGPAKYVDEVDLRPDPVHLVGLQVDYPSDGTVPCEPGADGSGRQDTPSDCEWGVDSIRRRQRLAGTSSRIRSSDAGGPRALAAMRAGPVVARVAAGAAHGTLALPQAPGAVRSPPVRRSAVRTGARGVARAFRAPKQAGRSCRKSRPRCSRAAGTAPTYFAAGGSRHAPMLRREPESPG